MFQAIVDGRMRAINRFNDRDYQVGDIVTLREGSLDKGEFKLSGRTVSGVISHVDDFGCQGGFVTLSLARVGMIIVS